MNTTTTQPQPAGYLIGERAGLTRIPVYRTPKGKLTFEPPKAPKAKAKAKATKPKAGDAVRRTKDYYDMSSRYAIAKGEVFTVKKVKDDGGLILEGKNPTFGYSPNHFKVFPTPTPEPTPVEDYARGGYTFNNFRVGDRVRRTTSFLGFRTQHTVVQGEVYTVAGYTATGGLKLEGKAPEFGYLATSFELVTEPEPTPPPPQEIEAAAKAVYAAFISGADWTVAFRETKQRYRGYAKAALLAARAVAP